MMKSKVYFVPSSLIVNKCYVTHLKNLQIAKICLIIASLILIVFIFLNITIELLVHIGNKYHKLSNKTKSSYFAVKICKNMFVLYLNNYFSATIAKFLGLI